MAAARVLHKLVNWLIMWLHSVIKMLQSVKFAEDKVLAFIILREKSENSATRSLT